MIITITNHKGGVGKTTSVANLGAAFHQLGLSVLLVDMDPQSNLSQSFGISDPTNALHKAMKEEGPLVIQEIAKGFDIVPASLELASADVELAGVAGREYLIKELLAGPRKKYDVVLIDTPPNLGVLTINALTATDAVYIPMQAEFLAMQGLTRLTEILAKIRKRLNKDLTLSGIFLTRINPRKVLSRDVTDAINRHYPGLLLPVQISDSVAMAEAPAMGKDVLSYAPKSKGAEEYMALAKVIKSQHFKH